MELGNSQQSATDMRYGTGIIVPTTYITNDEGCFELAEINLQSGKGIHRYRIYAVIRQDNLYQVWEDMGSSKNFKADEFKILGGVLDENTGKFTVLHNVGELKEMAEYMHTYKSMSQHVEPTDLIGAFHRKQEEKKMLRKSTYGYKGHKQRSI